MAFVQTLMAKLGLDGSDYKKGLDQAEQQTQRFASKVQADVSEKVARAFNFKEASANATGFVGKMTSLFSGGIGGMLGAGAGALGLGAMFRFAEKQLDGLRDKAKEVRLNSALLDVDSTKAQQIASVTDATGSSPEAVARAYEHIADAQSKIKEGGTDAEKLARAFAELGVSGGDLARKDFHAVFDQIALSMKNAVIDGNKLVALKDILGKSGPTLIPAFRKGFDGPLANAGLIGPDALKDVQDLVAKEREQGSFWKLVGQSIGEQVGGWKSGLMNVFNAKRFFSGSFGKDLPDISTEETVRGAERLGKRAMEEYERDKRDRDIAAAKLRLAPIAEKISEWKNKSIDSITRENLSSAGRAPSTLNLNPLESSGAFSRLPADYTSSSPLAGEISRANAKTVEETRKLIEVVKQLLDEAKQQTAIQKDALKGPY